MKSLRTIPTCRVLTDVWKEANLEIKRETIVSFEIEILGRLPHGTESGNSTTIYAQLKEPLKTADGRVIEWVFCEATLAIFNMAHSVFKGAEERDQANGPS